VSASCRGAGVHGRIPDFLGAASAAKRLAAEPEWRAARTIKVVPDRAQYPVRVTALSDGRLLYLAVPRLAAQPFIRLEPAELGVSVAEAAWPRVAAEVGVPVGPQDLEPVDLIVLGSVAVDARGVRLGKGAGYSDLEFALMAEAGVVGRSTVVATTIHDLQFVDDELPEAPHDVRVDVVVTPTRIIRCPRVMRPRGIDWTALPPSRIAEIPALATMSGLRSGKP
jgi:5-formyltetrahydrofolate cyclo-ligase